MSCTSAMPATGASFKLGVDKQTSEMAQQNCACVAPGLVPELGQQLLWKIQHAGHTVILPIVEQKSVASSKVALNTFQRTFLDTTLSDKVTLCPVDGLYKVRKLTLDVKRFGTAKDRMICEAKDLATAFKATFAGRVLNAGLPVVLPWNQQILLFTPRPWSAEPAETYALLDESDETEITLSVNPQFQNLLIRFGAGAIKELNFDFLDMGVGGLDRQLRDILTRAFLSRSLNQEVVDMYGLEHAKGILLYGPPGTGKTLIARTIAGMFGRAQIKIVNGPELLNKFVGQSEENLRKVFAEADKEWTERGPDSDLHVIIFDEIDALFKDRGSTNSGTGDTLVNQMLTILDGVDSPRNFLVIGMTNRKDLLDEALLRKGRIGIHILIGLPDEKGRREILDIHTKKLRKHELLDPAVNLDEWAHRTANFSGADIKGLINEATYFANSRNFVIKDGKPVLKDLKKEKPASVTNEDLENAFTKVKPSHGVAVDKLEPYLKRKFIPFSDSIESAIESLERDFSTLRLTEDVPTRSVLLSGPKGCGKTALAVHLASLSNAPFIALLTSGDLAGLSDHERIQRFDTEFRKTQQSKCSVIVLDNLEGILGATRDGRTYSPQMVLKLETILSDPNYRNLLVIGTSSYTTFLESVGLLSSFRQYPVKNVESYEEVRTIVAGLGLKSEEDIAEKTFTPMPIKNLLEEIQTFRALHQKEPWDTSAFLRTLESTVSQQT